MGHPAHYHNVSKVMSALEEAGHKIIIYARGKDVLFDLIEDLSFKKYLTEDRKKDNSKLSLIYTVLKRELQLLKICLKEKPGILVGTDIVITHIGKFLRIPSIILNEDDTDAVPLLAKYGFKYSSFTLSPECCDLTSYSHKKIGFNSYHELAYLHPENFEPEKSIFEKYFDSTKPLFLIRFAKLTAHHDDGIGGITNDLAIKLVKILEPHGQIAITSERELIDELEKFRSAIHPSEIHHIMAFSNIYIGDSQTMAAEAGVLGVPFIRFNDFVGRLSYLEELENKYKLGFGFTTNQTKQMISCLLSILSERHYKNIYRKRKKKMLSEKINYATFLTWFIDQYPESSRIMKDDPSHQYKL